MGRLARLPVVMMISALVAVAVTGPPTSTAAPVTVETVALPATDTVGVALTAAHASLVAEQAERAVLDEQARVAAAEVHRKVAAKPRARPTVRASSASAPVVAGSVWDRIAQCESGGNWAINTGTKYSGGLQMDMAFWRSYGGPEFASAPYLATREEQIVVAERARDSGRGYSPWPTCGRFARR